MDPGGTAIPFGRVRPAGSSDAVREGRNDAALPFRDAVRKRQLSGTARHGVRAVKGAASVGEIRSKKGPEMFAGGEFGGWVFPPGQRRR